ncbi:CLUMA_CG011016, isoform A [Clunio marinus]|uniref:5'-3' exoribonuclease 1 n=1 Tax=Clunio marinus TaxID=568069 RepID=A0A1J1IF62_9DIPT|nr:CLUMA_CG011016, isoform A [Clunio marinus]
MGVPKFFRYISERYPCLSELVREDQVPEFDNLYLDMNGIIHNCSHPNDGDVHFRITEEQIFKDIFFYLETLFNMMKPQKVFFLAVDGVAPRAKMNQQRGRRFRSAKEAEVQEEKARQKGEVLPSEARFDSNCITPGTPFMCRLNTALRYFIQHKISTSKAWRHCKVILSGHETPGEGEHKIMEYIRYLKTQKDYNPNTRHCLYGLDADLIMLGLCTHERHFSLLREEVKFGKKNKKAVSVSQQRFFLLHLSLMREYLEQEFIALKDNMNFPFDIENIIDDWVLMGFLVGNDFIPNIPNLHINSNALPMLYEAYIKTMRSLDGYINNGGYLNLARLQQFIENLEQFDRDHFLNQYENLNVLESKHQSAFNNRNDDTFGGNEELLKMMKDTEFEFDSSPDENEDEDEDENSDETFEKEFHQHRRDYYVNKMKYADMTAEVLAEQAECYIRALQWTLSYYYHGVQSWSWYYPHHYAPYISDLKNFKDLNIKFEMSQPFLPFQQLMSVLPAASRAHVPECYKKLMTNPDSELIDFYPTEFETDLNGKKQDWEAVVLIPFIDEKRLLKTLEKHENELSPPEKARNVHGPMYVYTYSNTSRGTLDAPLSFPSIGNLMCDEKKVYREEIQVMKEKLVLGPSKGALTDVFFTGFPTFKHLSYKSVLKRQNVQVFDQPSRCDNMMIVVKNDNCVESNFDAVSDSHADLADKIVHVGWPHLFEARVVKVCNESKTIQNGELIDTDKARFKSDVQAIKDHHIKRMGIDVGEIHQIVYVVQVSGEEYRMDQKTKTFKLLKTFERNEIPFPIQCVVKDVKAYRKKFKEEVPLFEAYKNGTEVFMVTNPFYGSFGEVTDVNCYEKSGRIKVMLTVPQEPDFEKVHKIHQTTQNSYMEAYEVASVLGINDNVFNRLTGTVLVVPGSRRQISNDATSKLNIGLQFKFPKTNEAVAGYTMKTRIWLYSNKILNIMQEYYCKYPMVFERMSRSTGNKNDLFFESDFFDTALEDNDNNNTLQSLLKWLAELPHQKAERRDAGSESIEKEVIEAIKDAVCKANDLPMKKITMQVKPHLLYAPSLTKSTVKAPDTSAEYQLFDRVTIAKESEKFSVGMKGTVIGISRVKDTNPVRRECVNKEVTYCEILFDNNQIERISTSNLINVSYGEYLNGNNKPNVKAAPEKSSKHVQNVPTTSKFQYSDMVKNAEKAPKDKPKEINDFWSAFKKVSVDDGEKKKQEVNGETNKVGLPEIVAPSTLPLPPLKWLENTQKERLNKLTNQQPPFPQPPLPFHHNNVQNSDFNFPPGPSLPFFRSNLIHQVPMRPLQQQNFQQPRNFNNNFNNVHRFRPEMNQQQQRPIQYQNPQGQFQRPQNSFQHQHQNQHQQQQKPGAGNAFIPLQAFRKATKGKNIVQTQTKPTQSITAKKEANANIETTPSQSNVKTESMPSTSQAENTVKAAKQPPRDNRKSRLAISFGK